MQLANGMTGKSGHYCRQGSRSWTSVQTHATAEILQTREKFESALSQAEQLRKRYFGVSGKKKPSRTRSAAPAEPVVRAAMKLVA